MTIPQFFATRVSVPAEAAVLGPFGAGRTLALGGESITLFKPMAAARFVRTASVTTTMLRGPFWPTEGGFAKPG